MDPGPSSGRTANLTLLASLPLSHPSLLPLVQSQNVFSYPSHLPSQPLNKFLNRLNSTLISRDENTERRAAWSIGAAAVKSDEEGYIVLNYGKNWITAALNAVASPTSPLGSLSGPLDLLKTLVITSGRYPSFERESVHPIMGKIAISLSRLIERTSSDISDQLVFASLLQTTQDLLEHSPAPFRATVPTLKPILNSILLSIPSEAGGSTTPFPLQQCVADLLAALHLTAGKAQSPQAWGKAIKEALGGVAEATSAITRDGWEEEPLRAAPPAGPAGLPAYPTDAAPRVSVGLTRLAGHVEEILALLRYPITRPVPIPIAQIVTAGLRCLNLTLDTPVVSYITPSQHALLLAALPEIGTAGMTLLGGLALSVGDSLIPHLREILDHSTWLTERTPQDMSTCHVQLLAFHKLLFETYSPILSPTEYPARLLKHCLARLSPLLETRSKPAALGNMTNGGGKRGKKRARGEEDGLIGGLEGREAKKIPGEEVDVIVAALELTPLLQSTPTLDVSLVTFSIRLHLSLHLKLLPMSATAFVRPEDHGRIAQAARQVLSDALYIDSGESGTSRGWKAVVMSVLQTPDARISGLLHPSLPPMMRSQPPLSALHYFNTESKEEKELRRSLGLGHDDKDAMDEDDKEGDDLLGEVVDAPKVPKAQAPVAAAPARPATASVLSAPLGPSPTTQSPQFIRPSAPDAEPILKETASMAAKTEVQASAVDEVPIEIEAQAVAEAIPPSTPFISTTESKRQPVVETTTTSSISVAAGGDDEDEPLPELDSGSDEDDDDEEDEDEDMAD